ncbi:hypothetical protein BST61_g8584 [Cercospora zeina]
MASLGSVTEAPKPAEARTTSGKIRACRDPSGEIMTTPSYNSSSLYVPLPPHSSSRHAPVNTSPPENPGAVVAATGIPIKRANRKETVVFLLPRRTDIPSSRRNREKPCRLPS